MNLSSRVYHLPLLIATVLIVHSQVSAQQVPYIAIGNSDGSPFNVPAQGDVLFPIWIDLPGWVCYGSISLYEYHPIITHWNDVEILYPWQYGVRIDGSALTFRFIPVWPWPDSIFHLADISFAIDADSIYWGRPIDAILVEGTGFVDTFGWMIEFAIVDISPLCVECFTSARDPIQLPEVISHSAYPNPFNASVTISLNLPREGNLDLTIYDIAGRAVRRLFAGRGLGEMRAIWDGADEKGVQVASGVYFYRMEFESRVYLSKVTLLR